jgi:HlyD family secretion protein
MALFLDWLNNNMILLEKAKFLLNNKRRLVLIVFLLAVLFGYYLVSIRNAKSNTETSSPVIRDLKQDIKIAGVIKPAEAVDLKFETSGRIEKINVKVDQSVNLGQELLVLAGKDARARLAQAGAQVANANSIYRQAEAQLLVEQSKLDELKRGPRTEAVDLSQSKLSSARQALLDAQRGLQIVKDKADHDILVLIDSAQTQLQEAYADADTAINQYCAGIFDNDQSANPQLSFATSNQQDKVIAEQLRRQMTEQLNVLQALSLVSYDNNINQIDGALIDANSRLLSAVTFLDRVKSVLSGAINLSSATLASYKSSVNTARSLVLSRSSSVTAILNSIKTQRLTNADLIASAEAGVSASQNAVIVAERELQVVLSGASVEEIKAQESLVKQKQLNIDGARAGLSSSQASWLEAQAAYDKTILKAPFAGKITKLNATVGQLVGLANAVDNLVSIISNAGLQIEVNVPEVDIAKVAKGNSVDITVDAYGETVEFTGSVSTIESGETLVNGVPTYKTTIQFTQQDPRLKPGMTANLDIITANIKSALAVPVRSLIYDNGNNYVEIVDNQEQKDFKRQLVETGLKSNDGWVEIKSGLTEGQKIVIQP